MDTTTDPRPLVPTRPFSRPRRIAGGVGTLALVGLGVAHTVTNALGLASDREASWPLFLIFGTGLSLVLWAIAAVAWRYSRRGSGRVARAVVLVAGVLCCALAVNVLRVHPEVVLSPAGPGPWSLVAGPALCVAAALPRRRGEVGSALRTPGGPLAASRRPRRPGRPTPSRRRRR
ncbi:hypothetical protein ACFQ8T_02950 [Isoptericola sp. NPDC056618]|uniref:hypothetical protein n=1 Tax=Isoptericola sp. NPDC056618 TaxID=3345878 RepID=UPI00367D22D8